MKHKKYEKYEVKRELKPNNVRAFMHEDDNVLEIDVYNSLGLLGIRHFINDDKNEYATLHCSDVRIDSREYKSGDWSLTKLATVLCKSSVYYSTYKMYKDYKIDKKSLEVIRSFSEKCVNPHSDDFIGWIDGVERHIMWEQAEHRQYNKEVRIAQINAAVTPVVESEEFKAWVNKLFGSSYLFADSHKTKLGYRCRCSSCSSNYWSKEKPKHNAIAVCKKCNKEVIVKTRVRSFMDNKKFIIYQRYEDGWIARHFSGYKISDLDWFSKGNIKKASERLHLTEKIRLIKCNGRLRIFYGAMSNRMESEQRWWDTKNGIMFDHDFYICPIGLDDAPIDENLKYAMKYGAEHMINCDWNTWHRSIHVCDGYEYLLKGGFRTLLCEALKGEMCNWFDKSANNIVDYFNLSKQRVNRLREMDGNKFTLKALRHEEWTESKVSQKNLEWITENKLDIEELNIDDTGITLEKAVNYIRKITNGSGFSLRQTLDRYSDYLQMAHERGMDVTDPIVCLNSRMHEYHDRYLEEKNKIKDAERQKELEKKFGNIRKDFKRNEAAFGWTDTDYSVLVPRHVGDIVREGRLQHHCVAASDIYFDRMNKRESFIMFLRKSSDIDKPYYTLEVEINGNEVTILQRYAAYDRQHDIKEVDKILTKWKAEVKKRMKNKCLQN